MLLSRFLVSRKCYRNLVARWLLCADYYVLYYDCRWLDCCWAFAVFRSTITNEKIPCRWWIGRCNEGNCFWRVESTDSTWTETKSVITIHNQERYYVWRMNSWEDGGEGGRAGQGCEICNFKTNYEISYWLLMICLEDLHKIPRHIS